MVCLKEEVAEDIASPSKGSQDSPAASGQDSGARDDKMEGITQQLQKTEINTGIWERALVISDSRLRWLGNMAHNPTNEDIAVADYTNASQVHVYDMNGKPKFTLDATQMLHKPSGVAYTTGKYCVTDCTAYVRYYNAYNGKYCGRWMSVYPGGVQKGNEGANLEGICVDRASNILVGDVGGYCISKHTSDGDHLVSFKVVLKPDYLAVTPEDNIIISDQRCVQIVNQHGQLICNVQYPNMSLPQGVCCCKELILVCDWNSPNIYRLTQYGKYVDYIPTDATQGDGCCCVTVNGDGTQIFVSRGHPDNNNSRVEVYKLKK
ncbi:uncharacterized protein [Amphiura filiformis]|uniref:uncharacterized protein n=1 Tax=Amphiura filiformis TaxID=82378 RepID=UPI003B213AEB